MDGVLDFGLDTPVPADVFECGVLVELAGVPATHLVITLKLGVLHSLLSEHLGGFGHEFFADPRGYRPMALRYHL